MGLRLLAVAAGLGVALLASAYAVLAASLPRRSGEAPLPGLVGIDSSFGLRNVGGNSALYVELLDRFRASQRDAGCSIRSDFDGAREKCLSATACVDATLAGKGVFVGGSGGAALTRYALYSAKTLGPYSAYTRIPANSAVFNSTIDNLWITHLSLRQVGASEAA